MNSDPLAPNKLTQAYLGLSEESTSGEVQWKLDFSHCGLAVRTMTLRAVSDVGNGGIVTCRITGDGSSSAVFSDPGGLCSPRCMAEEIFSVPLDALH